MGTILVHSNFWNSVVVQYLRLACPKDVRFRETPAIAADLVFTFSGNVACSVLYPDNLNEHGITRLSNIATNFLTSIVVICLSAEESQAYGDFLARVPSKISVVVCLPHEQFPKVAANFIWETASRAKINKRKIEKQLEDFRRAAMDPDLQATRILDSLIVNVAERANLSKKMNNETGTIRKTLTQGIPELFAKDFYIETVD
jgi:hypothetical protein